MHWILYFWLISTSSYSWTPAIQKGSYYNEKACRDALKGIQETNKSSHIEVNGYCSYDGMLPGGERS